MPPLDDDAAVWESMSPDEKTEFLARYHEAQASPGDLRGGRPTLPTPSAWRAEQRAKLPTPWHEAWQEAFVEGRFEPKGPVELPRMSKQKPEGE